MKDDKIAWYQSLSIRGLVLLAVLISVMGVSIIAVMETTGRKLTMQASEKRLLAHTESVAQSLMQVSAKIEGVAFSFAEFVSTSPENHVAVDFISRILTNKQSGHLIAGGGWWPEPYMRSPDKVLDSLFFAKDGNNHLVQMNDYNFPSTHPYQNEEWYVPAKWLQPGQAYWSQSYTDPFSGKPMVTCSVPYFLNGQLAGVVTIDVLLDELHVYLNQKGESLGGYLILLDRMGRFLSYPNQSEVINNQGDIPQYIFNKDLGETNEYYSPIAKEVIKVIDQARIENQKNTQIKQLAQRLTQDSIMMGFGYSMRVANDLHTSVSSFQQSDAVFDLLLEQDPILGKESFITGVTLPKTSWMLLVGVPLHTMLVESASLEFKLLSVLIPVALFILTLSFGAIHWQLVRPLLKVRRSMLKQKDNDDFVPLPIYHNDELGSLVSEFNQRSATLIETREQALSAAAAKQQFLANISHEIRTPMNGIMGAAELMKQEQLTHQQTEYLAIIQHSSKNLMSLLNDILDYSKFDAGGITLEEVRLSPELVGRNVFNLMKPSVSCKRVDYQYYCDPSIPQYILGDPTRIQQIMLNLLGNAIKFTESGYIHFSMSSIHDEHQNKFMLIEVSDSGIGIAADKLERIFDIFSQADESTTRKFGGTGLGLSITRQLAELMGGEVRVDSVVGKGSTFWVMLPLTMAEKNDEPPHESSSDTEIVVPEKPFYGMKCLVVEDNNINRILASKLLTRFGYQVSTAEDGLDALERSSEELFDVIYMDMQMPRMDGVEATRAIRASSSANQSTPIIAMTANAMQDDIWRCLDAGMQGHIAKPISENNIYSVTRTVLEENA
ncbi:ATP-binding protein [Vibrio sp. Of7-15]|uniref:ATP-binding protein n=1 Tax=Vibrio sp. Of7-15 TaxID=2724879 RepID=UPI001EF29C9B|nr:ATP-binding protein [Vibrio sp. Of7-15]